MNTAEKEERWVEIVREKVESLQFGVVQITVHDSRITLIERTEKTKLEEVPRRRERHSHGRHL